jgi:Ca2+-binding EF-hand superfamily protein
MSFLGRTPKCGSRGTVQRCCPSGTSATTQSFRDRDTDGDGFLTLEEYGFGRARGRERNDDTRRLDKAIFDAYDADGDGLLSLAEYTKLSTEVNGDGFILSKLIFDSADADGNKSLTEGEYDAARRSVFEDSSAFPFAFFDTDGNGSLTLREFNRAIFPVPLSVQGDVNGSLGLVTSDDFLDAVSSSNVVSDFREAAALFRNAQSFPLGVTATVSKDEAAQLWTAAVRSSFLARLGPAVDADGDGFVSAEEAAAAFFPPDLPPQVISELAATFVRETDTDGDMRVSIDEAVAKLVTEAANPNPFTSNAGGKRSRRARATTATAFAKTLMRN